MGLIERSKMEKKFDEFIAIIHSLKRAIGTKQLQKKQALSIFFGMNERGVTR
jgi:hypothetical protein